MNDTIQLSTGQPTVHPIRILLDGHLHVNKSYRDPDFLSSTPETQTTLSGTLKYEFEQRSMCFYAQSFLDKIKENNQRLSRLFQDEVASNITKDVDVYHRIIHAEGAKFEDWHKYCDENGNYNAEALQDLPELPENTYMTSITACIIHVKQLNKDTRLIALPVDPKQLFRALCVAQDTGAMLEFTMPKTIGQQGTLEVLKSSVSRKPRAATLTQ